LSAERREPERAASLRSATITGMGNALNSNHVISRRISITRRRSLAYLRRAAAEKAA
jgi:hypothetical protein